MSVDFYQLQVNSNRKKRNNIKHTMFSRDLKHLSKIRNRQLERIAKKDVLTAPLLEDQNSCSKSLMSVIIFSFTTVGERMKRSAT